MRLMINKRAVGGVKKFAAFSAIIIFLTLTVSAQQKTASDQISAGIADLKQELKALNLPQKNYDGRLSEIVKAEKVLQSGDIFLSLDLLEESWTIIKAYTYINSRSNIAEQDNESFLKEWQNIGKLIDDQQSKLSLGESESHPMIIKALIEMERNSAPVYYVSSKIYGENAGVKAGITYLGIAQSELDFALFCKQLKFDDSRTAPKLRSLESELSSLDSDVIKGFHQAEGTPTQREFINVNTNMKLAGELNKSGKFNGALYVYLKTVTLFSQINLQPVTTEQLPALKNQLESLAKQLNSKKGIDHSIGQTFLETAEKILANKTTAEPADADLKLASVIANQVLPRYLKYLSEEKH